MMWSLLGFLYMTGITALPLSRNDVEIPLVTIEQGTVSGSIAANDEYFEFHGIPYAGSTSDDRRFKAPLPPPTFTETFVANRRDVKCVRPLGEGFEGTEDCLVADVFTPTLQQDSKLPVMVWVKSRDLETNEKELSFSNFVSEDIVVVTLNFRESILGYLCLGTEMAPGNAGLKDIIAGLRWVRANIEQFGGDPEVITLIGHGIGAAVVDLVTLSPMANGLIHRVVTQSGNALAPWAVSRDNLKYAAEVAEALGQTITDIEDLSEFLTRVGVPALMAAINELESDNSLLFAPCIENKNFAGEVPFLIKTPFEIMLKGEFATIPLMTGFVDHEGTIKSEDISDLAWLRRMDESFEDFLQTDLIFEDDNLKNEVIDEIKQRYFGDEPITRNEAIAYHGDTMILVSVIREAWLRAGLSTAPIYLYQFSYKGTLGEAFVGPIEVQSAAHREELGYLFHSSPQILETDAIPATDLSMRNILVERWTNFAKTGNPTSPTSNVIWRPFTMEAPNYLRFNGVDDVVIAPRSLESVALDPYSELKTFWDEIYEEHFLDAQSNWVLNVRNDEDDELVEEPSTPSPEDNEAPSTPSPDEDDNEQSTPSPDEDEDLENPTTPSPDDGEPDSASTAVGYTFLIISAYALLDKFHASQLLL